MENGDKLAATGPPPSLDNVERLAQALGVDIGDLLAKR
jgi:hypothetical protein